MIALRVALVSKGLTGLSKKLPVAIARGLNEGGDKVRTQVRRALKTQTGVKAYKSITSRTERSGQGINRAAAGRLAYAIVATGHGMPITEFPVRDTGHGIDAKSWGVDHLFKRSFAIRGRGPSGFRARLGASRLPIRRLYGPALPKELPKGEAAAAFRVAAAAYVPPAVLKHLAKALAA